MTKVILLAALDEPCPTLVLEDGREVQIRQIDGIGMQLFQEAQRGDDPSMFWDVAARCLPSLTIDEVRTFTASQARQIVQIASGQAEEVLAKLGNLEAPASTGTPAPPSTIPSGT